MITDGKKQHYAVKILSLPFRRIASNYDGEFQFFNCFHLYRTKNFFKKHEKLRNDYDHCYVEMSDELKKRLKCNHGERLLKDSTIIYAD